MKQVLPFRFRDGMTLSPRAVNANLHQMEQDLIDVSAVAHHHWQTRLEFGAFTHATSADILRRLLRPHEACEITGIQVLLYGDADKDVTVSLAGVEGGSHITVTGKGADVRAVAGASISATVGADDDIEIVASSAEAAFSVSILNVVVSWRYKRPPSSATLFDLGADSAIWYRVFSGPLAGDYNSITDRVDDYAEACADLREAANLYRPAIVCHQAPLSPTVGDRSPQPIPDLGRTLVRLGFVVEAASGSFTATVKDESGVTQATVGVTGSGVLTANYADVSAAQLGNDVADFADDWSIEFSYPGAVTPSVCYAVLYWR